MSTISVQAQLQDAASWRALAIGCEAAGFASLLVADHPGVRPSPFLALAAAAAVTDRIGLGTYVSNAGIRDPFSLATDVATLDVLSGGRARLGLGAGHNPAEWESVGRRRPDVARRVQRCIDVAEAVGELLAGHDVDVATETTTLRGRLREPLPIQAKIPLTIGGANSRLLRWAGQYADVVGLSGMGRTLPDGYGHEVRWRPAELEAQLDQVHAGAALAATPPEIEVLVQLVSVTSDASAAARHLADELSMTVDDVLQAPFVLIGTESEIVAAIADHRRKWGISRHVVRADAMDTMARLLPRIGSAAAPAVPLGIRPSAGAC